MTLFYEQGTTKELVIRGAVTSELDKANDTRVKKNDIIKWQILGKLSSKNHFQMK